MASKRNGTRKSGLMRISRRIVNSKRHTQGFVINGKSYSRAAAVKMARKGQLAGVQVVGNHLQATPGASRRLTDLPVDLK